MGYIDWKKLKARVPLPDVLAHYGLFDEFTATPQGYEGTCPFCGSSAFKVNTEKNVWFCFGECKGGGEKGGGNILDFVARKDRVSLKEAATRIATWFPTDKTVHEPTQKQAVTTESRQEPAGADGGQGNTEALPTPEKPPTAPPSGSDFSTMENKPLDFALRGVAAFDEQVTAAGIAAVVAASYGAGYFTGKGTMAGRIVFPFHDDLGRILGYAGYRPSDHSWKYPAPDKFNPAQAVFGMYHAQNDEAERDTLVLCRTPLAALRYRSEHRMAIPIAITTDTLSTYHRDVIADLMADREKLLFVAPQGDPHAVDILGELLGLYFVKFVRS
jgi:hypothetical protein